MKVGSFKGMKFTKSGKEAEVFYTYRDVDFDDNGWADASKYIPEDYDLVYVKTQEKKILSGWTSGSSWTGLRLTPKHKVFYWKRTPEEDD